MHHRWHGALSVTDANYIHIDVALLITNMYVYMGQQWSRPYTHICDDLRLSQGIEVLPSRLYLGEYPQDKRVLPNIQSRGYPFSIRSIPHHIPGLGIDSRCAPYSGLIVVS